MTLWLCVYRGGSGRCTAGKEAELRSQHPRPPARDLRTLARGRGQREIGPTSTKLLCLWRMNCLEMVRPKPLCKSRKESRRPNHAVMLRTDESQSVGHDRQHGPADGQASPASRRRKQPGKQPIGVVRRPRGKTPCQSPGRVLGEGHGSVSVTAAVFLEWKHSLSFQWHRNRFRSHVASGAAMSVPRVSSGPQSRGPAPSDFRLLPKVTVTTKGPRAQPIQDIERP